MKFGGSLRIHAGEERLQRSESAPLKSTRLSAAPHPHHPPPRETPRNKKAAAA